MVPPAPDPDDAHLDHDWLKHVDVALRLRRTGLVMQFSSVHDAAAGPLIAHIDAGPPGPLQVLTEAGALGQAPEGATVVLLNAGEWPDWLNQFRSVVNQQRLLLLLWLTDEDQMILKRRAPDFYDWISLRVTIPPCAPGYVLDELAATARDGGVLALHNAPSPPPGWTPVHLSAGYAALRTALSEGDVWLSGVTAADECITALIAHAEAHAKGHRGGALALVNPGAVHESTTVLDARPVPWIEATERLRARGVVDPGVAAARADLDPRKILDTVPSPATLIQNPEWDTLLSLVRAGVGPEALGLAARLELVGVVAVWRGEGVGVSAVLAQGVNTDAASTTSLAAVTRSWITTMSGLSDEEQALMERGLDALTRANRTAYYSDDARLGAVGPTVMALRSVAKNGGAGTTVAEALAELLVLTAAWLPADEDAQAQALEVLRRLHHEGALPESVWAAALLRRAERLLDAPQERDRRGEVESVLAEVGALDAQSYVGASRLILQGRNHEQRGQLDEALLAYCAAAEGFHAVGDSHERLATMGRIADIHQSQGKLDEAMRIYREDMLPIAERLGEPHVKATALSRIADILDARGQLDEAMRIRREDVLTLYKQMGDAHGECLTKGQIADMLEARGQIDEALQIWRDEVLPVVERLGDARGKAVTMGRVADFLMAQGQFDDALRIRRDIALPIFEQLGDERGAAVMLSGIADILAAKGQTDGALRIFEEDVLPVFERLGDGHSNAIIKSKIADILETWGELDEALRIWREDVLPIHEQSGNVRGKVATTSKIADVLQARGQLDDALRIQREEVLPVAERLGDVRGKAITLGKIADVLHARGQLDEALRLRQTEELPIYERLGDTRAKAATMNKIAELLEARGQLDEAQQILRDEVLPVFERLHTQPDLLVSQAHLATNLLLRHKPKLRAEARALLTTALESAKGLNLPAEAEHIRSIFRRYNLSVPA